jgi:hypothetical protein
VRCALALFALACGQPMPASDAGRDAGTALAVSIEGPSHAFAGEEACFSARVEGLAERVRWTWGDGEASEGVTGCHTFPFVGARVIGVEASRGASGASATRALSVVLRPAAIAPSSSSPIVHDGERVWVVNPDHATIAVLRADPPELLEEIAVGARPRTIAVSDGVVAVACQGDATLRLIDARTFAARATIDLGAGSEPYGVLADPRGGVFAVSLRGGGEVRTFSSDGSALGAVRGVLEPRGLAMSAEGTLLATRWRASSAGAAVYTIDASDPRALALTGTALIAPVAGVNSDTDNDGVLSFTNQIVPSPDAGRAILPALRANVLTGSFVSGEPLTSFTTARAALGEVSFGAPSEPARESFRHAFDDLDLASATASTSRSKARRPSPRSTPTTSSRSAASTESAKRLKGSRSRATDACSTYTLTSRARCACTT